MAKIVKKPIRTKRGMYKMKIIDDDVSFRMILYERKRRFGIPFWEQVEGERTVHLDEASEMKEIIRELISEYEGVKEETKSHEGLVDEVRRRLKDWDGEVK
ncbi:hypothetical protein [Melghirimyces algeriensis]|uniref:Uncharacterized protein n=1 Tax=Melghirimyces algeriensis TaxID=910412 RepID=A0A521F7G2_9BACL|nr:hypothetical protein [Melghirimyces algeriensis]SMO92129.1 hypothetical protein SAMN06264849_11430 [Melghirimyces algeriensis]